MVNGANAAIFYRPEGFETTGPRLMGRQAAGEGFLKGFVQHADVDRLYCYTAAPRTGRAFPGRRQSQRQLAPGPVAE